MLSHFQSSYPNICDKQLTNIDTHLSKIENKFKIQHGCKYGCYVMH